MADVLGLDIGGANTKAVFLQTQRGRLRDVKLEVEYFPIWKEPEKLASVLSALKKKLGVGKLDCVGVTMTAELSDAYKTKRQGVNRILANVNEAFPYVHSYVLNTNAELESAADALQEPIGVASANWAATGWLVAQRVADCVVVDVGSTSSSIVPVLAGKVAAKGKTDLEKLICGELVYSGALRTNVAATVNSVPVKGAVAGVASELFALSADVHLILRNITERQYTCETADGRGKTVPEAQARLARVVCADVEMLTAQEIEDMAKHIYDRQIVQVAEGLSKVYAYTKKQGSGEVPIVVTGLGRDFLARKAAERIGVKSIVDLETLIKPDVALATPAFAVALMTATKLEGAVIDWMQQQ